MRAWMLLPILLLPAIAMAQDAVEFRKQAIEAYYADDNKTALVLFEKAIAAGDTASGTQANAANAAALSGQVDKAFEHLARAIDGGSPNDIESNSSLNTLHADPRWAPLVQRVRKLHPEVQFMGALGDWKLSAATRYFPVRRALRAGMVAPDRQQSVFREFYGTVASWVGDYDEASKLYQLPFDTAQDPVAKGFTHAQLANAFILQRARKSRAVFLNESHGEVQTRAANFTLLAPLRKLGFKYLALETLHPPTPEPSGPGACDAPKLLDAPLPQRGYPILDTGTYTREPVYGEIIREALRLGYTLVSYEGGGGGGSREQHHADMINCLFKADPKARVVVIAGFGHIAESAASAVAGGSMGYRFKQLSGIDPLTVDNAVLRSMDTAAIEFPKGDAGRSAQSYVLTDASGKAYGNDKFDMMVYVRPAAHRGDARGSWLALGGARVPSPVASARCKHSFPCLVEARAMAEGNDAIPNDRCVIGGAGDVGCTLYLRPGKYRIGIRNEKDEPMGEFELQARR